MGLHVRTSKIARTLVVWKKGQASFRNHRHKWRQPNRTVLSDLGVWFVHVGVRGFESPMSQNKPNAFVVAGFLSPSPMPPGQASGQEINDLVALAGTRLCNRRYSQPAPSMLHTLSSALADMGTPGGARHGF